MITQKNQRVGATPRREAILQSRRGVAPTQKVKHS